MNDQLRLDAARYQYLFTWNGPLDPAALRAWVDRRRFVVPEDLMDLWEWTGGGEMFESETILAPGPGDIGPDGVDSGNTWFRSRGLPSQYLVFEEGGFLSAVRQTDATIVELDQRTFELKTTFPSLDDWYCRLIRAEYAARYGLSPAP